MSEACRGEGGRVWVYCRTCRRAKRAEYFLEDMYPAYGNLVPRDVASRAIYKVVVHMGLGMHNPNRVYLDLSHIPADYLERKLRRHPRDVQRLRRARIRARSRWRSSRRSTTRWAASGSIASITRTSRASSLPASAITSITAQTASVQTRCCRQRIRARSLAQSPAPRTRGKLGSALTAEELEAARQECVAEFDKIRNMNGTENAHKLHHELGDIMYKYVSIERDNNGLSTATSRSLKRSQALGQHPNVYGSRHCDKPGSDVRPPAAQHDHLCDGHHAVRSAA